MANSIVPAGPLKASDRARCRQRVVIVDDYVDAADTLAQLLRHGGHDATALYSGVGCVEIIRSIQPDLIIADLALPGLDGLALARQLDAEGLLDRTLLAAFSGHCRLVDRRKAAEAGFERFLAKPSPFVEFQQLLTLSCAKSRLPHPAPLSLQARLIGCGCESPAPRDSA
jgi:CheY-like chemotaxis protein